MNRNLMHLNQDQIDDLLIGDLATDAQSHLDSCAECQELVSAAQAPLASFAAVSLAWSERRSATLPVVTAAKPVWGMRLGWATTAAVLVAGVTIPVMRHETHTDPTAPATMVMAATGSTGTLEGAEAISRDNQMLQDIDRALAGGESSAALGLVTAARAPERHTSRSKNTI